MNEVGGKNRWISVIELLIIEKEDEMFMKVMKLCCHRVENAKFSVKLVNLNN